MGKNSKKHNNPEEKRAWAERPKKDVSTFIKVILSEKYNPDTKPPSKRDLHRGIAVLKRAENKRGRT